MGNVTLCKGNYKSHAAGQGEHTAFLHLTSSIPDSPGFATCGSRQASQKGVQGDIFTYLVFCSCVSVGQLAFGALPN